MGNFIMNYNSHPLIREAIKQSEKINARCERSISLYAEGDHVVINIPVGINATLDYKGKSWQLVKGLNDIFVHN